MVVIEKGFSNEKPFYFAGKIQFLHNPSKNVVYLYSVRRKS